MRPLPVAAAVALAVRAVLHRDQADFDQRAVERLRLGLRRPRASCCSAAEGQTIGRLPSPQSCGWVKVNSQSTACTSAGGEPEMRRRGLEGRQHLPGPAPCPPAVPSKSSAARSACQQAGDSRRKPVGPAGRASPCASRALSVCIAILLLVGSRRANLSRSAETAISACLRGVFVLDWGMFDVLER